VTALIAGVATAVAVVLGIAAVLACKRRNWL
jgi:ABC-type spermidine/putrescine transport system permease subunit II